MVLIEVILPAFSFQLAITKEGSLSASGGFLLVIHVAKEMCVREALALAGF